MPNLKRQVNDYNTRKIRRPHRLEKYTNLPSLAGVIIKQIQDKKSFKTQFEK